MDWEVKLNGSVGARPLPVRSLEIPLILRWNGNGSVEVQSLEWWSQFPNYPGLDTPPTLVAVAPQQLDGGTAAADADVLLRSIIGGPFIQQLEERRNGGGPVTMKLWLNIHHRMLTVLEFPGPPRPGTNARETVSVRMLSHPLRKQIQFDIVLQRDEWLRILADLHWDEFEVFEVAVHRMRRIEGFQKALGHLRQAQVAFRQGQWSVTVVEARKACEAAALEVQADAAKEPRAAFEKLMTHILPADADKPKRDAMSLFMLGLGQLRHPGAHGSFETQIERADAELALTVAVSLFRYIGDVTARRA